MTSRCQPLDTGIIQTLKLGYRQNLHTHVMRHINADIASDPIADVSIALAICCISRSWNKLNARTISRCFAKCGFTHSICSQMPGTVGETPTGENDEQELQQQEALDKGIFPAPVGRRRTIGCLQKYPTYFGSR